MVRLLLSLIIGLMICFPCFAQEQNQDAEMPPTAEQEKAEDTSEKAASDKADSEEVAGEETQPTAVTTDDPEVPVDQLKLLLMPLTKDELLIEANAWRDLVKAKVTEITQHEISIKHHNEVLSNGSAPEKMPEEKTGEKTGEIAAVEEPAQQEVPAKENTPQEDVAKEEDAKEDSGEGKTAEKEEKTEEANHAPAKDVDEADIKKKALLEALPILREERIALLDRFNTVLKEYESKGGDTTEFKLYASAVSGIHIDVTDATSTWVVLKGWITSPEGGVRWAWNFGRFFAIIAAFWFAASFISTLVVAGFRRTKNPSMLLEKFLATFIKDILIAVGFIVALSALEIDITPLLAAIGAAGFVIGLALQGTLSNFASGLLILAYRPFDVGDFIEAAGVKGTVGSMNMLSTLIKTPDNKHIIVPNNNIWGNVITNVTASKQRRVDLVFGIGYQDDMRKAQQIMEEILEKHELVLKDPAPDVRVNELADSSVNFVCRPWAKSSDYWTVLCDVTRSVKEAFDEAGISIPFPQQDIHVHHTNGNVEPFAEKSISENAKKETVDNS